MQRTAAFATVEERGVYWAPYTKRGCPVLYAVKSSGERLRRGLILLPHSDPDAAIDFLWRQLDRYDPPRRGLHLVRDDRRKERTTAMQVAAIHPLMDALTWDRMQHDPALRRRVLARMRAEH